MPHKIGIVTKNLTFFNLLNKHRRNDENYEMELVKSMESFNQIQNMGKVISSFIFDSSHTKEDIISFGKFIKNSRRHHGALIFLAFDNFEIFQAITTDENFSNAKIINMPSSVEEIYLKLISDTEQIDGQKSKVQGAISSAGFLNLFIEATMSTVKEMTECVDITHSTPSLLDYAKLEDNIAIRGKLIIDSPHFKGSFFISFPEKTYLNLCSKVLYEDVKKIDKENEDLVSELCNIIYGKSKVLIAKLDMKMGMVIPTHNRDAIIVSRSNVLIVKLATDMGDFYVKVAPGLM